MINIYYYLMAISLEGENLPKYAGKVRPNKTIDFNELLTLASQLKGSPEKSELEASSAAILKALQMALNEGKCVQTPFGNYNFRFEGSFQSEQESFDRSKHSILLNCNVPASMQRDFQKNLHVERISNDKKVPMPLSFLNTDSKSETMIESGCGFRIGGKLMDYDEEDLEQGVFLIHKTSFASLRLNRISEKRGVTITGRLPDNLDSGDYELEIKTKKLGSTLRTGKLEGLLTVI